MVRAHQTRHPQQNGARARLSWHLRLVNDQTRTPMVVQLIAIDGVAVTIPGAEPGDVSSMVSMAGGKFHVVPCPNVTTGSIGAVPVCVDEWIMMPSSRVDLWVTFRADFFRHARVLFVSSFAGGAVVSPNLIRDLSFCHPAERPAQLQRGREET